MIFLDLPPKIRLRIYPLLLDPNQYRSGYEHIKRLMKQAGDSAPDRFPRVPSVTLPRCYVTRYTPSILLLNRQITAEALPVLYNTELTLEGTPLTYFVFRQMDIAEFISETLLQRMRYVILRLQHPEKFFVLTLLEIWGKQNNLQQLIVYLPPGKSTGSNWSIVESRLETFAYAEGIPLEMRIVDKPLEDGD